MNVTLAADKVRRGWEKVGGKNRLCVYGKVTRRQSQKDWKVLNSVRAK